MPLIRRDRNHILLWLTLCALLVAGMVALGGYTRLSGSGLSITTWKPIHGTLPPLSYAQWQEEFTAYRLSPQFQLVNYDMTLDEFKTIFWPEYLHRLLGRAIGMLFFIPLVVCFFRRSLSPPFAWRLFGIFALGGLQGVVGWLMVASGLVNEPRVSHIRLALHFSLALTIFALLLWAILDILHENRVHWAKIPPKQLLAYKLWFSTLCLQLVFGAFMAGLHCGLVYNSWPDMNGQFIPDDIGYISPWYMNIFNNIATIQFIHRTLAILLCLGFAIWWISARHYVKNRAMQRLCLSVLAILATQFALGVLTLLHMVPLLLAWLHQLTALVLFAAGIMLLHHLSAAKYAERHVG